MKKITLLGLVLPICIMIQAQDNARARRMMQPFHSISLASEIDAELILSEEESIAIDLKGAKLDQIITEVKEGVLKIKMKTGSYKDATLKVQVHYKEIKNIEVTGRAAIWSYEELYLDQLGMKLYNGGAARLKLYCDSLTANLSQGAILTLKGEGKVAHLKVNTSATFSGYEYVCQDVYVTASSTGKAKVSASNYLEARASTGGFVGYVGEPRRVDSNTSLKGEIIETFLEEN